MYIEIKIPLKRPALAVFIAGVMIGLAVTKYKGSQSVNARDAIGGRTEVETRMNAELEVNRERLKQAVLERREEILRYQIQKLEEETKTGNPETMDNLAGNKKVLIAIIKERRASEELLKRSLEELWDAQGVSVARDSLAATYKLSWPVEPLLGISAHFDDEAYTKRFGIPHHAIDIPTPQGTVIHAPSDGTVTVVKDNGLGYSYVAIAHRGGIETVYGHVSGFIAKVGDNVREGDPIAYTGGRPGSPGAGLLTTGSHLHFVVKKNGQLVDPLRYLEDWPGIQ